MAYLKQGETYVDILAEKNESDEKFRGLSIEQIIDYRAIEEIWNDKKYRDLLLTLTLNNFIVPLQFSKRGKMEMEQSKKEEMRIQKGKYEEVSYEFIKKVEGDFNTISVIERVYNEKELSKKRQLDERREKERRKIKSRVPYTKFFKTDKEALENARRMAFGLNENEKTELGDLLPEQIDAQIDMSPSYMANRESFIIGINDKLRKYKEKFLAEGGEDSCEAGSKEFNLMIQQEIVRDYLNLYTPHRGLLLYHGLGAGKTCSSIAIAEGMKSDKEVILLTPASLEMNYMSELKHCGDSLYKLDNYWQFLSLGDLVQMSQYTRDDIIASLSEILSLDKNFIETNTNPYTGKKGGVWFIHSDGQSIDRSQGRPPMKYDDLVKESKIAADSLNKQLDQMIRSKYNVIRYNGLRAGYKKKLGVKGNNNPFDHKVVIIEESHNFVGGITNKLSDRNKKDLLKDRDYDGDLDMIFLQLYKWLQEAEDVRIVMLSGTPIINYPNELGVMYNILRGKLVTFNFDLKNILSKEILDKIKRMKIVDTVSYDNNKLVITRNPYSFVSRTEGGLYEGIEYDDGDNTRKNPLEHNLYSNAEYLKLLQNEFRKMGIEENRGGSLKSIKMYKNLPDDKEEFMSTFISEEKNKLGDITYGLKKDTANQFKRRTLGLTSHFRSTREELMPKILKPPINYPPRRKRKAESIAENEELEIKANDSIFNFEEIYIPMKQYQYGVYEVERQAERKSDMGKKGKKGLFSETSSSYKIFSRVACNFVFPEEILKEIGETMRPRPEKEEQEICTTADSQCVDEGLIDKVKISITGHEMVNEGKKLMSSSRQKTAKQRRNNYENKINLALNKLRENADTYLNYQKPGQGTDKQSEIQGLEKYSPKFNRIFEKIQENEGCQLLYSQFRTVEGIEVFKYVLDQNGYSEFKLKKDEKGEYIIDMIDEDIFGKKHYALYTGTEDKEEKEIMRQIFNSMWDKLPRKISEKLKALEEKQNEIIGQKIEDKIITEDDAKFIEQNKYGDFIELLMITSSGAEGITLKNTRVVHLMEPYWHPVRLEQVIGRARRICSHHTLKGEERNVRVYLYMMTFDTVEKIKEDGYGLSEEIKKDVSRFHKDEIVTTDQMLYEISLRKKQMNNVLLDTIKSVSIDCNVYNRDDGGGAMCFTFPRAAEGQNKSEMISYAPDYKNDNISSGNLNVDKVKREVIELNIREIDGRQWKYSDGNEIYSRFPKGTNDDKSYIIGELTENNEFVKK
tara:strand:- start:1096 stop:4836 length:3741 start_codon:yes stop_codon:yes gene_type:complete